MNKHYLILLNKRLIEIHVDIESHNYMANFWNNTHIYIGVPTTIFSSIVTASIFSHLSNGEIIVGILSLVVTALVALSTFLNPSEKYLNHKVTKSNLILLRNKAQVFISLIENNQEVEQESWKAFELSIEQLYSTKPQVPEWVKNIAIKRVKKMRQMESLLHEQIS